MKTFILLFLSCVSLFGADDGIQVTTTTTTNAEIATILTTDIFTRDGQTNLVRSTLTIQGKNQSPDYKFYHDGFLVGEIRFTADVSQFTAAANSPYSLQGTYRSSAGIWQMCICTKGGVVLDCFTATNGVFRPVSSSNLQNLNKMTTDESRARAKMMEHLSK